MTKKIDYIQQFKTLKEIEKLKLKYYKNELIKSVSKQLSLDKYSDKIVLVNEVIKTINNLKK